MAEHLCLFSNLSKERLKQLLSGRNRQTDTYKCGGCLKTFETICVLHCHCMKHNEGGSYYFDHMTNTAFPKYDSKCSYAQADIHQVQDNSFERILEANARSINNAPQQMHDAFKREMADVEENQAVSSEAVSNTLNTENVESLTHFNVKNIARDANGLITFEMEKEYAHLSDAVATVIMNRMTTMGDSWLKFVSNMQVMVPCNVNKPLIIKSTCDGQSPCLSELNDTDHGTLDQNNDTLVIDYALTLGEMSDNDINKTDTEMFTLRTETDTGVCMPHTDKKISEDTEDILNNSTTVSGLDLFTNDQDADQGVIERTENLQVESIIGDQKDVDKTESIFEMKSVPDKVLKTRPVRNRKPSSRLNANDWETPTQRKKIKEKRYDIRKAENTPAKVDLKQEGDKTQGQVSRSGRVNIVTGVKENDDDLTTTEEASSADISASKVLLALSKRGQEDIDHENKTDNKNNRKLRKRKSRNEKDNENVDGGSISIRIKNDSDSMETKLSDVDPSWSTEKECSQLYEKVKKCVPSQKQELICKTCGKIGNKTMIEYHMQAHQKHASYKCDTCGKGFKTKQCYRAHLRQHGEKKYKCDQCSAAFFRKQYLDTHRRKHTGEVPYICDLCGSGFMESYILQRHITNKHRQERNYLCNVCGERFFRADTRDNHRSRHFEPTLKCAYCSKMFKAELDRRKHELTHTGEKQVYCPICKYGFAQLWSYYRHMWKRHSVSKEEAKGIRVKNPDLVYMRNKYTKYENKDKPLKNHQEPIYTVGKRSVKPSSTNLTEVGSIRSKYETIDNESESTNYEFVTSQTGELTHGDFTVPGSDMYQDVEQHHQLFVDSSDMSDSMVLQESSALEARNALVLGDGQNTETTNISIVLDDGQTGAPRNVVILSDYTHTDIEEYTKQYSTVDL